MGGSGPRVGLGPVQTMSDYMENNRKLWDGWTEIHSRSSFYDVDGFREGDSTLNSIELEAVGEVRGKKLLHLQCHFGLDTLSWARLGARVAGVDFSPRAISLARVLSAEVGLSAEFLCAEVTDLPAEWEDAFDIVFTSYGVLPWLPDLGPWARSIHRVLRPGGSFHLVEFHPLAGMLDDEGLRLTEPYFRPSEPSEYRVEGSYADPKAPFCHRAFEWAHSLSEVQMSLLDRGMGIRGFREYAFSPFGCFPFLEESEPGRWTVRGAETDLPLVFSLHAEKAE